MSRKRVLIVGANSFLAVRFVEIFIKEYDFDGIYNINTDHLDRDRYILLVDNRNLYKLLPYYDTILFFSAFIPSKGNENNAKLVETNVCFLSQIALKYFGSHFVYCSSVSVYGTSREELSEVSIPRPLTNYAKSKLAAEYVVQCLTSYSIIRFSSIYGKGMLRTTILPSMLTAAMEEGVIRVYGEGTRRQNYIFVDDACRMLNNAMKRRNSSIYLGVGLESISNLELANVVADIVTGSEVELDGEDSSPSFCFDGSWTYDDLGIEPKVSIMTGVKNLYETF